MSKQQAAEISEKIASAKEQFDRAANKALTGVTSTQEIDGITNEINEAYEEILDALEMHRQLLR